jgi:predicted nucleic acid-binding protein
MKFFYIDASALCKRYVPEKGTPVMNHLFASVNREQMMCLMIGAGEVISIFVRKKNSQQITSIVFAQAMADFRAEVIDASDFELISPNDAQIMASWYLIEKYSLNSNDAILLRSVLDTGLGLNHQYDDLVLVAADERLLRAAMAEGLKTFNPEKNSQAELDALLSNA